MSTLDLSPAGLVGRATTERALLVCGAVAGPLFTLAWIVESATRADYNPLRHPVSTLELGDPGWTQVANFLVAGVLGVAFAVGLWRALRPLGGSTWGPLLVGAFAIGLIGAGLFATDPVSGYPPGTPDLRGYSTHGALHDLFSVFTFAGLPAACFVFARRFAGWHERGWSIYSVATGVVFSIAFVLASMGFSQVPGLVAFGGLFQRLTITTGWTWLTLLAVSLLRRSPAPENTAV
ncbi:MAG: DUF998 domain-containing protein [Chloroflexi bacterium]|nr:MAG: DUF998 domain-containing protein [Chloroflexota bacterium]